MDMRKLKFGVCLPTFGGTSIDLVTKLAVEAESLGIDSVYVPDHLFLPPDTTEAFLGDRTRPQMFEAWTTLALIASKTQKVKLGTLVSPMPLRNPCLLAKTLATLDVASGGRVILGVGAGWFAEEFTSHGLPFDDVRTRFEKTKEAVTVIKKLWTEDFPNYAGKYNNLNSTPFFPKPLQKPHPPIYMGGNSRFMRRLAVEMGSGWIPGYMPPQACAEKVEYIRKVSASMSKSLDEFNIGYVGLCHVAESERAAEIESGVVAEKFFKRPFKELLSDNFIGEPKDCVGLAKKYQEVGVREVIFQLIPVKTVFNSLRLLADEVIRRF